MSRFLALGGKEKLFLLHCLAVVAGMRVGLSLLSYRRLRAQVLALEAKTPASMDELRRVAWGVAAAARMVPRASCLTQALAGQYLLARSGKSSHIRIGVARGTGPELKAHAWLLSGNHVVLGGQAHSFAGYSHLIDYGS